jgi:putrescine importer
MAEAPAAGGKGERKLRRTLGLWDLVFYGIILIQPTAPLPLFGIVSVEARGHMVTTILIAMVGMLFTAISYGRMARAYPAAGSAYTYVGREIHPSLGYITGWSMAMDYMLNPILCTVWCSKAGMNIAPEIPYAVWVCFFASLFTMLNLRGVKASARTNEVLAAGLGVVVLLFFIAAIRYLAGGDPLTSADLLLPFYNPETFSVQHVFTGTSIAVLTYIGFDGISTLSEEVKDPRRNVLRATVLTCLITGILASVEVYFGQLVWPEFDTYPDVDTAFVHVAGRAGGEWLLHVVNFSLLIATIGSGSGAMLGAARLLYGMGRDDAIPKKFFGQIEPVRGVPRNNVLFLGGTTLVGAFILSFQLAAELLNFGAFIAFMGVNLSAFMRYWVRAKEKKLSNLLPPLLGFVTCFYIWLNLRWMAKLAGGAWVVFGIVWGAVRTRGFRQGMTHFETPEE